MAFTPSDSIKYDLSSVANHREEGQKLTALPNLLSDRSVNDCNSVWPRLSIDTMCAERLDCPGVNWGSRYELAPLLLKPPEPPEPCELSLRRALSMARSELKKTGIRSPVRPASEGWGTRQILTFCIACKECEEDIILRHCGILWML